MVTAYEEYVKVCDAKPSEDKIEKLVHSEQWANNRCGSQTTTHLILRTAWASSKMSVPYSAAAWHVFEHRQPRKTGNRSKSTKISAFAIILGSLTDPFSHLMHRLVRYGRRDCTVPSPLRYPLGSIVRAVGLSNGRFYIFEYPRLTRWSRTVIAE